MHITKLVKDLSMSIYVDRLTRFWNAGGEIDRENGVAWFALSWLVFEFVWPTAEPDATTPVAGANAGAANSTEATA